MLFFLAGWLITDWVSCLATSLHVAWLQGGNCEMKQVSDEESASEHACMCAHACTYSWTYRWTNAASNAMNSLGYNGWNILCYIHVAIPVSKKLLCTSESIDNVEVDTFPAVMIQTYKLKFMNGFFFPFCLEKKKEKEGQCFERVVSFLSRPS